MVQGVPMTQSSVNTAQPDGGFRKHVSNRGYGLLNAGVPIGHDGGDPHKIRQGKGKPLLPEALGVNPVTVVWPRDFVKGLGHRNRHLGKLARAVALIPP
jgi:hypothetical protein